MVGKSCGGGVSISFKNGGPDDGMHMEATIPLLARKFLYKHIQQGILHAERPSSTISFR